MQRLPYRASAVLQEGNPCTRLGYRTAKSFGLRWIKPLFRNGFGAANPISQVDWQRLYCYRLNYEFCRKADADRVLLRAAAALSISSLKTSSFTQPLQPLADAAFSLLPENKMTTF